MATKSKKSLTNIPKRISRGSIHERKDRSSTSTRERRSTTQSLEETFEMMFKKFCTQFKSKYIPNVIIVPYEPLPGDFPELPSETSQEDVHQADINKEAEEPTEPKEIIPFVPNVLTVFDNYDIPDVLNTIIFKHFLVDRSMLISLRKSLVKFDTLGTLKLEFCQLDNTLLRTLKTILQRNESITDLSIDGNPNSYQNFYILLKDTKLTHISMCSCQINDRGIHLIALQLRSPFDHPLISINLSSNFISDDGANSIANALRINRTLLFLNLADNWITDNGCIKLMNVLRLFSLKHEEIVIRRHRIMDYLINKADMIKSRKLKALQDSESQSLQSSSRRLSKDSITKTEKDVHRRKSSKGSAGSPHGKNASLTQAKKSIDLDMQLIEQMVELDLGKDNHPFVKDSYAESMEIYCKGNFKLTYLNLAYNKIGLCGLQEIIAILRYQHMVLVNVQEGLLTITLQGNLVPEYCEELNDISEIIKESRSKRSSDTSHESTSRRSSKRKKSGSARVSITL